MQHHLFWVVFVAYFTFFNKCETKQLHEENGDTYILSQILQNRNKPPIFFYIKPAQNDETIQRHPENLKRFRSIEEKPEDLSQRFISDISPNVVREEDELDEDDDDNYLRTSRSDERAYLLYHLLRTTMEEEDIDPQTIQELQPAQEFLRNAFIGRCRRLNKCVRECPKKAITLTCTVQCKQIFDDLDECDRPKKKNECEDQKCGHTMPPSWLL